jgi:co-chaperonin GroES (HSP10)
MNQSVKPAGDRVLVELAPYQRETKSGIVIVGGKSLDLACSKVIAIGPECNRAPWGVEVGDRVLHLRVAGVKYDGSQAESFGRGDYAFIQEKELLAVLGPNAEVEGVANRDADGNCVVGSK